MKTRWVIRASIGVGALALAGSAHAFSWASIVAWFTTMQREVSAIAIQTKQNAVAANQIADAEVNTRKTLSVAMGALMASERVRDVVRDYDPQIGQPMLLKCNAQMERGLQVDAFNQAARNTRLFVSSYATVGADSRVTAQRDVLQQRRELFCSVSEAKAGLCELKPNGMQGWDTMYDGPFGNLTMTPDFELAAANYIANLADIRAPKSIYCKSEACATAQQKQIESVAIGSMVAASLTGQLSDRRITELE